MNNNPFLRRHSENESIFNKTKIDKMNEKKDKNIFKQDTNNRWVGLNKDNNSNEENMNKKKNSFIKKDNEYLKHKKPFFKKFVNYTDNYKSDTEDENTKKVIEFKLVDNEDEFPSLG